MTVKTAISIDEALFERAEVLARQLRISRSRLFTLAAEEFIDRHDNQRLLNAINAVYDDGPDAEEQAVQQRMRSLQRRMVEGQW